MIVICISFQIWITWTGMWRWWKT